MGLLELFKSLARNFIDGIRRNKLPACLSLIALVLTTSFSLTGNYDERPRYRKFILPEVEHAETQFFDIMRQAEAEPDEPWRAFYFLEGHRRAKHALQIVQTERPLTENGRKAQRELIRYYELVDDEFEIIRSEMSNSASYDYMSDWKRANAQLLPIRARWLKWLNAP